MSDNEQSIHSLTVQSAMHHVLEMSADEASAFYWNHMLCQSKDVS